MTALTKNILITFFNITFLILLFEVEKSSVIVLNT